MCSCPAPYRRVCTAQNTFNSHVPLLLRSSRSVTTMKMVSVQEAAKLQKEGCAGPTLAREPLFHPLPCLWVHFQRTTGVNPPEPFPSSSRCPRAAPASFPTSFPPSPHIHLPSHPLPSVPSHITPPFFSPRLSICPSVSNPHQAQVPGRADPPGVRGRTRPGGGEHPNHERRRATPRGARPMHIRTAPVPHRSHQSPVPPPPLTKQNSSAYLRNCPRTRPLVQVRPGP